MKDWFEDNKSKIIIIAVILILVVIIGILVIRGNSSGSARAKEREITVYSADGVIINHFEGVSHVNIGYGSVWFDYEGKNYTYTNCFVEIIDTKGEIE